MELLDKIYIGELVLTYGNMLTEKQLSAVKCYYLLDMGLTEIAENEKITRQGAYDLVTKSTSILTSLEEKLGMVKLRKGVQDAVQKLEGINSKTIEPIIKDLKTILE